MVWLARFGAILLAAVAGDTAIASAHASTPAFTAAGAGALLAVITLVSCWSRPAIGAAAISFIIATVFAVGTLGGVAAGPAFTGVSPTDSAAIVFAAAIVAATAAAFLLKLHPAVRAVLALAGAYCAVNSIAAVQHGGLAAAFDAAPLAWTRGSYAAAELFLPLAAAGAFVYAVVQFSRRRPARGTAAMLSAAAFVAVSHLGAAAAGAAGQPTIVAFEHPASTSGTRWYDSLPPENGLRFTPAAAGDVPAEVAAAAVGVVPDASHALAAVAGIGNDLYAGALAGSAGALRNGRANSIDKALLLRDVIRVRMPDVETAFARCTLASADADALVAEVRAARDAHPPVVIQAAGTAVDSASSPAVKTALQRWSQTWKTLVQQTQDDGRTLKTELRLAGVTLPAGRPAPERLRALAAQHVWLRARVGGTWTDLDPTFAAAAAGKTRCTADHASPTLSDDAFDVLGVRVVVERYVNGQPVRDIVFDRIMRTAELGDRDVSFMFAEPVGIDTATAGTTPGTVSATASNAAPALPFTPVLRVGSEQLVGTAFTLPAPMGRTNGIGRALTEVAGALQAQSPVPTPASTVAPAIAIGGVWMELSVRGPNALTTVRNPIFDRIGFAARSAHATPPPLAAQPDAAAYAALQTIWNVAVSAGHNVTAGGPAELAAGNDVPAISAALARAHAAYYALRRSLADEARGASVNVVADRPGISVFALTNAGTFIDIASDDAIPIGDDDARPVWSAAAVLAERHIVNSDALLRRGMVDVSAARDALATFAGATAGGARVVALSSPADAAGATGVSDDARARMTAHLHRGATLLALPADARRSPAPYAYWIVDPERGTLRDENADGRHQEAAQEAVVEKEVTIKNISTWRKFTCTILPVIRAAGFALSVAHGGSPFSLGGAKGLGAANAAATQQAVDNAQSGLDRPACAGS